MSKDRTEGQLYFLNYTDSDKASFIMVTKSFTVHALVGKMSKMGSYGFTHLPIHSEKRKHNLVKYD